MNSAFSLRNVYGDHMVLQRGKPIRIAGSATSGTVVSGKFLGNTASAVADNCGEWVLEFPPVEAGGPYEFVIQGDSGAQSRIELHDILVGDVWFCSGQSNMECPVWCHDRFFRLKDGEALAAAAHDNRLRLFQVPSGINPDGPCADAPGRPAWKPATTPEAVQPFSAVGYWFGKGLRETLEDDVPIGLVNASWGATPIQPWIPEEAFRSAGRAMELEDIAVARIAPGGAAEEHEAFAAWENSRRQTLSDWVKNTFLATAPERSAAALTSWATPEPGTDSEWKRGSLGTIFVIPEPGITWVRREIILPESYAGRRALLRIGSIEDCDDTFLDGTKIGATGLETPKNWIAERRYAFTIPAMPGGRHILAVRILNLCRGGYLRLPVTLEFEEDGTAIDIAGGEWMRRVEFTFDMEKSEPCPIDPIRPDNLRKSPWTPTSLYNAMVHPFTSMNIRGVAWYQGCRNSFRPEDYLALSHLWIDAWRRAWRDEQLPFLVTQLTAYAEPHPEAPLPDDFWRDDAPCDRIGYAPLREVQERLFDQDAFLGLACTIDVGDHSNPHPANKRDVGLRLAHEALRVAYDRTDALPGPRLDTVTHEGGALRLRFKDVGDGLEAGAGIGPHLFAVSGADRRFVWAEARLNADSTVLVWSTDVPNPVSVRYAWSAYPPNVTLRRKGDGLPVFPFRVEC